LGLLGGIVFLIGITPLGVWTLANPILAVAMALALRKEYDKSFVQMLYLESRPGMTRR
jgi:hypothetical protein